MAIVRWILAKLCKKVWFKGLLLMDLICTQGCSVINSEGGPPCGFLILSRGVIWQNMNSGDTEYDKMWAPGMIILAENRINQDENLSPVRRCAILVLMDSNCMNLRNIRNVDNRCFTLNLNGASYQRGLSRRFNLLILRIQDQDQVLDVSMHGLHSPVKSDPRFKGSRDK